MPRFGITKREGIHRHAGLPDLRFYRDLSTRLPEWMAVYIAPNEASFESCSGDHEFNEIPMILHQDEAHYFISPKKPTPATRPTRSHPTNNPRPMPTAVVPTVATVEHYLRRG